MKTLFFFFKWKRTQIVWLEVIKADMDTWWDTQAPWKRGNLASQGTISRRHKDALGKRGRVQRTQFTGSRGSIKTQPYCAEQTERASFVGMTLAAACPQRRHCDSHSCSRALKFIGGFHFFLNWHVTSVENTFKMCLQMCQATYWPGAVVSFLRDHLE